MKFQTRKMFADYEKSVNNLYNIYYEMLEQPVKEDITIYDKAKELDAYHKEINSKELVKFIDVRYLIIDDYKVFNPEYILKKLIKEGKYEHSLLTSLKKN